MIEVDRPQIIKSDSGTAALYNLEKEKRKTKQGVHSELKGGHWSDEGRMGAANNVVFWTDAVGCLVEHATRRQARHGCALGPQ
jgi:hypothetical protein